MYKCYAFPADREVNPLECFEWIYQMDPLKPKRRTKKIKNLFLPVVAAFDIETSKVKINGEIHAIMYHWQLSIDNSYVFTGRTWDELEDLRGSLETACREYRIYTAVHNLSYEFHFLKGVFDIDPDSIFAMDLRKIAKFSIPPFDFYCSYIHSGKSLDRYARDMKSEYQKMVGYLDYSIERLPDTPITPTERGYMVNDVTALVGAVKNDLAINGDTLYTIPLTKTGYVRRDVKDAMSHLTSYLKGIQPDFDTYWLLVQAFRGGNTHANYWQVGKIHENVYSFDFASSYPYAMMTELYPQKFNFVELSENKAVACDTLQRIREQVPKVAILTRVRLYNVQLKDPMWPVPYISFSKCLNSSGEGIDNGRVMYAEMVDLVLTDIDLDVIESEYTYDTEVLTLATAEYKRLPKSFRNVIMRYYEDKTKLKGIEGKEVEYTLAKELLNSLYGMTVFQPVRPECVYNPEIREVLYNEDINPIEQLRKSQARPYFAFQWGVWITAYARRNLERLIRVAGHHFLYCDTDSVKCIDKLKVERYNKHVREKTDLVGAYAYDSKGDKKRMGIAELDGHYTRFATLGAKKYAYEDEKGLHVTISGVRKNDTIDSDGNRVKLGGASELAKLGGLEAFANVLEKPLIFQESGGSEAIYNDNPEGLTYKGYPVTSNMVILEHEYTLDIRNKTYRELILSAPQIFAPLK